MTKEILFESIDGIGILTVNRPEARNALNWVAQQQFADVVNECSSRPSLRALIITGTGDKAFVAGGDIKELVNHQDSESGELLHQVMSNALQALGQLQFPVIAAVNGDAIGGGCEILTACDLRISVAQARFTFAQVRVGLTTGWGGTGRLIRLIGQSRASDWLLTGRTIDAGEAERCGFVNHVVSEEIDLLPFTLKMAQSLAQLPQQALVATKSLIHISGSLPLNEAYEEEKKQFAKLWLTEERREAMRAIIEKREPEFTHSAKTPDSYNNV